MEIKVTKNGRIYINTTPHPVTLWSPEWCGVEQDGQCDIAGPHCESCELRKEAQPIIVPPCGILINARAVEVDAGSHPSGVKLVKTSFVPDPSSANALAKIEKNYPGAIVIGSVIAAQAFPGRVVAMCPAPGYERVAPDQKRMLPDKFTVF